MMKNTLKNPSILLTENKIGLIVVIVKTNNPPEVVNNASKNKYFLLTRFIMKIKQKGFNYDKKTFLQWRYINS